jgi:REP element-mobilizing transposase RayT
MQTPSPIYALDNCHAAFQLDWSLTIFWHQRPPTSNWLKALQDVTEHDGVRVLEHRLAEDKTSQFLVSTQPAVSPHSLVRSVKGRLQYLVRKEHPKAFQRNYCLRSVGSVKRQQVEDYVRTQPRHHRMADPTVQAMFERYQIHNPQVDLSCPRQGDHALYWYNLHIVFVHTERFREVREHQIAARKAMIEGVCTKQGYLLSRGGIVSDHVHLTLGGVPDQSPGEIAVRFMNNLAYREGMKPVFDFGYYVGTFGEYDLGAIPRM